MPVLFVYGTLKRGCKNHHHIADQRFLDQARTAPGYALYDLGDYPGLVADAGDTQGVTGELWEVDEAALSRLDEFEGVDEGLYRRQRVELRDSVNHAHAHTYLYARDPGQRRIGSTWRETTA
jgi:gamma-glutamylaminecyclotransferase